MGRKKNVMLQERGCSFHGLKDFSRPAPRLFSDNNPQGERRNCGKASTIPLAHISYRKYSQLSTKASPAGNEEPLSPWRKRRNGKYPIPEVKRPRAAPF